MVRARSAGATGKPAFAWQALLISVPIFVLAVIGFFSLRQDRAIAEHEAAERAQEIAEDVLARFAAGLTNESLLPMGVIAGRANAERLAFAIGPSGDLVSPRPFNGNPAPAPLNVTELGPESRQLWSKFQRLEVSGAPTAERLGACRKFISSRPMPRSFWPVAAYSMGLLLMENGEWQEAVREFERVISEYPDGTGESGLPLAPLCRLRLFEISQIATQTLSVAEPVSAETVLRDAVFEPTMLSEYLVHRVGEEATNDTVRGLARDYLRLWNDEERTRQCYAAWSHVTDATNGPNARCRWFGFGEEEWVSTLQPQGWETPVPAGLAASFRQGSHMVDPLRTAMRLTVVEIKGGGSGAFSHDRWVTCWTESELGRLFTSVVNNRKGIPDYFGLGLEIAGKRVLNFAPEVRPWHQIYYGGKGGGSRKEYLDETKVEALASNLPMAKAIRSAAMSSADPDRLRVLVYLTSPETLFKRQTTRSFWFGCLIASASVAAAIGLAAAWRAFSRQHQLAEMKTNFVSSVSHELRAPIASIRLLAESLEKGRIQEAQKQSDYFRFIGQECRRLSSLIENVLDFSRIEQGRKQYDFEPTDVQGLVKETVALMQTYANEKGVRIELEVAPEVAELKDQPSLDGRAIQQALVNLIDNAVKHSPQDGRVGVKVGVESEAAREDASLPGSDGAAGARPTEEVLAISVEDHGTGILAEEHEKIFERFYRTGSELRRESQGVGIGLSLVKHIVEAHGGRVGVRSVVGEGSVFTIEVPIGRLNDERRRNDK